MRQQLLHLTIAGSILGQMIGSRAERLRLKSKTERENLAAQAPQGVGTAHVLFQADGVTVGHCAKQEILWDPLSGKMGKTPSTRASICF